MYITFYRTDVSSPTPPKRETPRVGHQFNVFDYMKDPAQSQKFDLFEFLRLTANPTEAQKMEEQKEEKEQEIAKALSELPPIPAQKITVCRSKESLRNFFNYHVRPEWYDLPAPPSFPVEKVDQHYTTFFLKKPDGGKREINAPDEELKHYLSEVKRYFELTLKILPHDVAHAYTSQRTNRTAMQVHQANDSHFFLKLDMHGFFPSHTKPYIMSMLQEVYPIGFLLENAEYKKNFERMLDYNFYKGVVPQGTPLSPTLTNICMVPFDFILKKKLKEKGPYVYTRYADDLTISSKFPFMFKDIEGLVNENIAAFKAPFTLNEKKTRYGSRAGANWNLGMMLNKDNRITMGHKANKRLKAILFNIFSDYRNNKPWDVPEAQKIQGVINYYTQIDPDTTRHIISTYERKFSLELKKVLKFWIVGSQKGD